MIRFAVTIRCDHVGCQNWTSGDCRVEPGEFMARGVFDVQPDEEGWSDYFSRNYCPEHRADAGVKDEPRWYEPAKTGPCDFYTNPFALDDAEDGRCRAPGNGVRLRRKADGVVQYAYRCAEHAGLCNDEWEFEP